MLEGTVPFKTSNEPFVFASKNTSAPIQSTPNPANISNLFDNIKINSECQRQN